MEADDKGPWLPVHYSTTVTSQQVHQPPPSWEQGSSVSSFAAMWLGSSQWNMRGHETPTSDQPIETFLVYLPCVFSPQLDAESIRTLEAIFSRWQRQVDGTWVLELFLRRQLPMLKGHLFWTLHEQDINLWWSVLHGHLCVPHLAQTKHEEEWNVARVALVLPSMLGGSFSSAPQLEDKPFQKDRVTGGHELSSDKIQEYTCLPNIWHLSYFSKSLS